MRKIVKRINFKQKQLIKQALPFVILFMLIGAAIMIVTRAAVPSAQLEAESGTRSGAVSLGSDTSASLNKFIQFGNASTNTGRCPHTATRICYNGKLWNVSGVNLPWYIFAYTPGAGDFGGSDATGGGVRANKAAIGTKLSAIHDSGTSVVRWWMFEGGAWQINRDANGKPTSLNSAIYSDIDAALELADQYDIYYNFVLFGGMQNSDIPSAWRTNTTYRQDLANVLAPLFARYKDNPRLMTWEIWNEPDWQYENSIDGATAEQATDIASRISATIRHEAPKTMVTVGQWVIRNIGVWKNVDLDYDSPHWYEQNNDQPSNALLNTSGGLQSQYGTNRPIVIGEYPQTGTQQQNLNRMNELYARNYAGAWTWALFDAGDGLKVDLGATSTFSQQHDDIGPR